jgi:hypothetical protein
MGLLNDHDPSETQEWVDSLRAVVHYAGPERGAYLLARLREEERKAVRRYVPPAAFQALEDIARPMGFAHVACDPLVRSSYHANRQALAAGAS